MFFEQVIPKYPTDKNIWRLYLGYASEFCKDNELRTKLFIRAIKNCNSSSEFWTGYITHLEKDGITNQKVSEIIDGAIQ